MRNPLLIRHRPVQIATRFEDAVQRTVRSKVLNELQRVSDSQAERPERRSSIENILVAG